MQAFEHTLDIPQLVDQIGKDDRIKWLVRCEIVCIETQEFQFRMPTPGLIDHVLREVDADSTGGPECREKIATTATDLEHDASLRNE